MLLKSGKLLNKKCYKVQYNELFLYIKYISIKNNNEIY